MLFCPCGCVPPTLLSPEDTKSGEKSITVSGKPAPKPEDAAAPKADQGKG